MDLNAGSTSAHDGSANILPVWSGKLPPPFFQDLQHIQSPQLMMPQFNSATSLMLEPGRHSLESSMSLQILSPGLLGLKSKEDALAQTTWAFGDGGVPRSHYHQSTNLDTSTACANPFKQHTILEQQIARTHEGIRALLSNLKPSAALDTLLLSAMLASPSSAPSSRISAALDAVAAVSAAASLPCGAGGGAPAGFPGLLAAAGPVLPALWIPPPATGAGLLAGPRAPA